MNNSSTNWWSYYSYHGGIRKAALSDMPVACRNRRGFSAEKESHPLRHVVAKSAPLKIRQLEASCRILRLCFLAPPFQIEPTSLGFDLGFLFTANWWSGFIQRNPPSRVGEIRFACEIWLRHVKCLRAWVDFISLSAPAKYFTKTLLPSPPTRKRPPHGDAMRRSPILHFRVCRGIR